MVEYGSLKGSKREVVPRAKNLSWQRLDRRLEHGIPFLWHHHPEMELTMTLNCRGQRFVGDDVSPFEDGDIALVGSNLPHSWVSSERLDQSKPFRAKVIWFDKDWLAQMGRSAVELGALVGLADRAQRGLTFAPDTCQMARPMIEQLFDMTPAEGFTLLLELLRVLSLDNAAAPLATRATTTTGQSYARIDRVLQYLHENYADPIRLDDLAQIAALSPSGLHRMFQKHLQTTISDYLTNLRIGEACARLATSDIPIGIIAHDVGYGSQANFNRHFIRLRSMTPRAYRKAHRQR
jgi:AraC-like DNA-binding protein